MRGSISGLRTFSIVLSECGRINTLPIFFVKNNLDATFLYSLINSLLANTEDSCSFGLSY